MFAGNQENNGSLKYHLPGPGFRGSRPRTGLPSPANGPVCGRRDQVRPHGPIGRSTQHGPPGPTCADKNSGQPGFHFRSDFARGSDLEGPGAQGINITSAGCLLYSDIVHIFSAMYYSVLTVSTLTRGTIAEGSEAQNMNGACTGPGPKV